MQFASSEVARLPRLAPLSLVPAEGHTHIQSAPAATAKHTLPNNVLTDIPRKPFTFRKSNGPHVVKILQQRNGKVFLVWLQSSSRRTAMAGSGWSLPSPPLCSHTSAAVTAAVTVTGSPGRNHSGLSAGGGGAGMQRGCRSTAAAAAAAAAMIQQHQAPFQRENKRSSTRVKIHRWSFISSWWTQQCPLHM